MDELEEKQSNDEKDMTEFKINGTEDEIKESHSDNFAKGSEDAKDNWDEKKNMENSNEKDQNVVVYHDDEKKISGLKDFLGKMDHRVTVAFAIMVVIIGGLASGLAYVVNNMDGNKDSNKEAAVTIGPSATKNPTEQTSDKSDKASSTSTVASASEAQEGDSVADVVENVMPAIVAINCKIVETETDMFGRSYEQEAEGSGSGIIIGKNDDSILIATNNHVVSGATEVTVVFYDEKQVTATVKGTNSNADLAVVQVKLSDIPKDTVKAIRIASLGDSKSCKVGEMAIAIGNALGYGQSVTVGVISAVDREVNIEDSNMTLLQTDAAINPGNSGGALINSKGQVIGINSVKYVSEDTEGMGYAIPISTAVPIINTLMNYEEIPEGERAYLGIIGQDIDETSAARYNAPLGVGIQEVSDKSPAKKAGLVQGDIITKVDGTKVTTMTQIQEILQNKKGGDICEIVVSRLSKGTYTEKTIKVTLGARKDYVKE